MPRRGGYSSGRAAMRMSSAAPCVRNQAIRRQSRKAVIRPLQGRCQAIAKPLQCRCQANGRRSHLRDAAPDGECDRRNERHVDGECAGPGLRLGWFKKQSGGNQEGNQEGND